jgi:AcrR family transcriptional regulator
MEATIQVLLKDGKSKLTTTRIAERAGVSVGTLYQYFPNKSSLLQAILKEHLDNVALAVEKGCAAAHGRSLSVMAEAITSAFVQAKFRNIDISIALYAVSDDVEGKRIARSMHARATKAMSTLFQTASGESIAEPNTVAATLLSALAGVSRATLEMGVVKGTMMTMQQEMATMTRAYLEASTR